MAFRHLVPLRIPSRWAVDFNNLVELEAPEALSDADREAYLSQDLLSLRSTAPEGAHTSGLVVDVGWRPDGDPAGQYLLHVVGPGWDETGIELATRSLAVIRDAIELCLHRLNGGDPPARVQEILVEATTIDGRRID
jgi:hypothetical protein